MTTEANERNWVEEVGEPAYASIKEMVAALRVDYDRLEELKEERDNAAQAWALDHPDEAEELAELEADAGDCESEDEARERISEDPLSLRIFGDINGDEAASARLEVQDWFKPWTQYFQADSDVLMAYVGCFYFG